MVRFSKYLIQVLGWSQFFTLKPNKQSNLCCFAFFWWLDRGVVPLFESKGAQLHWPLFPGTNWWDSKKYSLDLSSKKVCVHGWVPYSTTSLLETISDLVLNPHFGLNVLSSNLGSFTVVARLNFFIQKPIYTVESLKLVFLEDWEKSTLDFAAFHGL